MGVRLKKVGLVLSLPLALVVGACSQNLSPNSYDTRSVGQVNRVERGTIESYRWVQIQKSNSGTGTLAGAGIGAAAGSTIGSGRGRGAENVIGAIGGALLGGLIGNSIEKSGSKQGGFEYLIRTESGSLVSLVQADSNPLPEGAPVVIMFSGTRSRVVFDHNATRYHSHPSGGGHGSHPRYEAPQEPQNTEPLQGG